MGERGGKAKGEGQGAVWVGLGYPAKARFELVLEGKEKGMG